MDNQKAVPGANAPGNNEGARQFRRNALQQVAGLKQKIHDIQQQSLRAMHASIDNFFTTQAQETRQQLAQQEEEMIEEVAHYLPGAAGSTMEEVVHEYIESEDYSPGIKQNEVARQAVEAASKGVEDAMRSAIQSVEQADKALGGLHTAGK